MMPPERCRITRIAKSASDEAKPAAKKIIKIIVIVRNFDQIDISRASYTQSIPYILVLVRADIQYKKYILLSRTLSKRILPNHCRLLPILWPRPTLQLLRHSTQVLPCNEHSKKYPHKSAMCVCNRALSYVSTCQYLCIYECFARTKRGKRTKWQSQHDDKLWTLCRAFVHRL